MGVLISCDSGRELSDSLHLLRVRRLHLHRPAVGDIGSGDDVAWCLQVRQSDETASQPHRPFFLIAIQESGIVLRGVPLLYHLFFETQYLVSVHPIHAALAQAVTDRISFVDP